MDVKESENSFTGFLFGNSLKALETLENVIRVLLIVCWVVAALPFGGASLKIRMSSFFATCFSCLLLIHIYRTYGRPRWSRDVPSPHSVNDSTGCPSHATHWCATRCPCSSSAPPCLPASLWSS